MANSQHASFSLDSLMRQVADQERPPVEKWNPEFCGDIDMCIKADGSWFYMGTPIGRKRMVKLFSSVLRRDKDGKTYLVTPVEKIGITVEDAHFVATTLNVANDNGRQLLVFETNVGDKVIAGRENPIWVDVDEKTGEPRPYLRVRGNLDALISRSVFYQMVELAMPKNNQLVVKSDDQEFLLGDVGED